MNYTIKDGYIRLLFEYFYNITEEELRKMENWYFIETRLGD